MIFFAQDSEDMKKTDQYRADSIEIPRINSNPRSIEESLSAGYVENNAQVGGLGRSVMTGNNRSEASWGCSSEQTSQRVCYLT